MADEMFDLREHVPDGIVFKVERALELSLDLSTVAYGNDGDTAGYATSEGTWLRVQWRPRWRLAEQAWTGAEAASVLRGVARPELLRSMRWADQDRDVVWKAEELTLIGSKAVAPNGTPTADPGLSDAWWVSLKTSLTALAAHPTGRVGMGQEHLSLRIAEVYGGEVATVVEEWTTAHADLHWGNLTAPDCWLLDWEDWGAGPRGLDAATLWGFSLGVPALADRVLAEFADDLATRSGRLAQLLFCANVERAFRRSGREMPFTGPAIEAGKRLLSELPA
ncbi:aminoglycoside phosphotransferase [Actinomadura alba]|uniref:aminoglycoside phosphotransferase n=1 Tax=Actinomadura alba TaxID=406431 RepID=UPI001C9C13A5|nr:aminoglycoside phosphotransferase [Actinomadura alba]